jgi:hypothetical protein
MIPGTRHGPSKEDRINTGLSTLCTVKAQTRMAELRSAAADLLGETGVPPAETKDPSGGTTGRVKPYRRLGWMGARAEYSLVGEE